MRIGLNVQLGHRIVGKQSIDLTGPVKMINLTLNHLPLQLITADNLRSITYNIGDTKNTPDTDANQ